jgi:hypothetical protein
VKRLLAVLVVVAMTVWAQHAPSSPALSYSGFLEDSGVPVTGPRLIGLSLFAQQSAGSVLCQIPQAQIAVSNGHFHVPLNDATCDAAIKANPEVWVEVRIGTVVMPRQRIGAVPYALSVEQGVPSGAVMMFARTSCPEGWDLYAPALGRYLVGVDAGVELPVGVALTNGESRAVGMHTHPVIDPGHQHGYFFATQLSANEILAAGGAHTGWYNQQSRVTSVVTTNVQVGDAGTVPGTPAPYVGLMPCVKR